MFLKYDYLRGFISPQHRRMALRPLKTLTLKKKNGTWGVYERTRPTRIMWIRWCSHFVFRGNGENLQSLLAVLLKSSVTEGSVLMDGRRLNVVSLKKLDQEVDLHHGLATWKRGLQDARNDDQHADG